MQKDLGRNKLYPAWDSVGFTLTVAVVALGVSAFFRGDSVGSFVIFFLGDCDDGMAFAGGVFAGTFLGFSETRLNFVWHFYLINIYLLISVCA